MNKINFENPKRKRNLNKSFYVALGICLVAIGAASFTTYKSVKNFVDPSEPMPNNHSSEIQNSTQVDTPIQGITDPSFKSNTDEIFKSKEANTLPTKEEPSKQEKEDLIIFPSGKEIIKGFSDTNPVYSKTLSDWRVHTGTDFKADQGSLVKSMNSGTVTDVFDDPAIGMTVVIDHDQGFISYYSGLGNTVMVKKDDKVRAGQDIGSINDIPSEAADGYHLHLGVKKDGIWVDPMSILKD